MCRFVPIFIIAVASLTLPADAMACGVLADPMLYGFPSDHAEGVPTDVIPIYYVVNGNAAIGGVSLASDDGDDVTLSMRSAIGTSVELVPASALKPNTHYTLSVSWLPSTFAADTLSFTTGSGPFAATSGPPHVSIESYHGPIAPCGIGSRSTDAEDRSCIMLDDQDMYQYEFVGVGSKEVRTGSFLLSMSAECLELRRRYPNGKLGEPTEICRSAGPQYDLRNTAIEPPICTGAGLRSAGLVRDLIAGTASTTGSSGDAGTSATVDADAASASTVAASSGPPAAAPPTAAGMTAADGGATATSAPHASSDATDVTHGSASESSDSGGCSVSHATTGRPAPWIAFLALACATRALRRRGRAAGNVPAR